ncbi:CIA30 family protein [Robertkochia flava]|uniref:CIA30 family protein n=1 Tax=Robertkochia flava TaxID=3447986 RepID=UPI001CCCB434|nr:CIA30 family protein [Robertkochia marina]
MQSELVIYDFASRPDTGAWAIVNDVVMGGASNAQIRKNQAGNGVFSGHVSLENNGGFASVRLRLSPVDISDFSTIHLRVKGEPARYQVRCKSNWGDPQSYVAYFETNGTWQEVVISLGSMYPTFRGNRLDMPDYSGEMLSEVALLIGNKKEEDFKVELEKIWLE